MRQRATYPPRRPARGATFTATLLFLAALAAASYLLAERHQAPIPDTPAQAREKIAEAKSFVTTQADTMLAAYQKQTGSYPDTAQGLWALVEVPPRVTGWKGPYLTQPTMPIDPWGQPYQYACPSAHHGPDKYDVSSAGPDQKIGTSDDITNW